MPPHRFAPLALALCVLTTDASSQNDRWLEDFAMPGVRQKVFALGTFQGDLIAGGSPLETPGEFLGHVALYDGHRWESLGEGVSDTVHAIAEYEGDLIVGGSFLGAGGVQALHIARWDGAEWWPLGQGIGTGLDAPTVHDLAVFQGELYAIGEFTSAGGAQAYSIARWNGSSWSPVGGGLTLNPGQQGAGRVLYATPTLLYAGGQFKSAGGVAVRNLAAWDGTSWSDVGGGIDPNGRVASITEFEGDLYIGGTFNYVGSSPDFFHNIARWDGSTWDVVGGGLPDGVNGVEVDSLEVFGGALHATGNFNYAGGVQGVGVLSPRVARWDGTAWSSTGGIWGSDGNEQDWPTTVWKDKLIVGGRLSYAGSSVEYSDQVVSTGVVGFDGNTWIPLGRGLGIEGQTNVIVPWQGGWVVGGAFTNAGTERFGHLAFWNGGEWSSIGDANARILDAVVFQGDLIVTGDFTEIAGVPVSGCARFDGTTWSQVGDTTPGAALEVHGGQLYLGGLGSPKRFDGNSWVTFGEQLFGYTVDLHSHAGKLWIGGNIGAFAGPGPHLLCWDGTTMLAVGAPDNRVTALGTINGELVVGGEFNQIGGVSAKGVARFDGSTFSAMGGGLGGGGVFAFEQVESDLYAAGSFTPFFGAPLGFVARWTGAKWESLADGLDNAPLDLAYDAGAQLLYAVGGNFQVAGDRPCRSFAAWRVGPSPFRLFCDSVSTGCPCTGPASSGGCPNGVQRGGLLQAYGFSSLTGNALTLASTDLPPGTASILFTGSVELTVPIQLANGMRCVGSPVRIGPVRKADANGAITRTDVIDRLSATLPDGSLLPGTTWYFQDWYRDPAGPCGLTANTTSGIEVLFTP